MDTSSGPRTEQRLLDASLVLLVAYNVRVYRRCPLDSSEGPAHGGSSWPSSTRGAAGSPSLKSLRRPPCSSTWWCASITTSWGRNWRIVGVAIIGAGFIFKAFTFYLNSSYLE